MPDLSPGCTPPPSQTDACLGAEVLILDLDGTILDVNSFPLWVMFMLQCAAVSGPGRSVRLSVAEVARIAWLLGQRRAGLIGHEALKWRLQAVWKDMVHDRGGIMAARFVARLQRHVRPCFAALLAAVKDGRQDALLATAAPDDYAVPFGMALGLTHVVATASGRARNQPGNLGPHKRDAVLQMLARKGWQDRPRILFTDHLDDLPLIAVCRILFWFGTDSDEDHLRRALPDLCLRPGHECAMQLRAVSHKGAARLNSELADLGPS